MALVRVEFLESLGLYPPGLQRPQTFNTRRPCIGESRVDTVRTFDVDPAAPKLEADCPEPETCPFRFLLAPIDLPASNCQPRSGRVAHTFQS